VSEAALFLTAFAHALATATLYREGHPARERAFEAAYHALLDLQARMPKPLFTFLGDEIVCGTQPVRELRAWDWTTRLSNAGVQRLEFDAEVTRAEFDEFLDEVLARLTLSAIGSAEARQMRQTRIRFGVVGVKGEVTTADTPTAVATYSLGAEADAVRWLHEQAKRREEIELSEAEAVVRSLSLAMHGDQQMLIPLLELRDFDEYTTTHSMNVCVLAMAFAEHMGLGGVDVRAFGLAGLLHDIGKVRIPIEVLTKPGKLTDEERLIMNRHPVDGARFILTSREQLDVAAIVAYEHHIMLDGGGYPVLRYPRECHFASKIVHVCDVYDALRTKRPYRDAWPAAKVNSYLGERAGLEFDPELIASFVSMMDRWETRIARVDDQTPLAAPNGTAGPNGAAVSNGTAAPNDTAASNGTTAPSSATEPDSPKSST
jgi:putative nucleotidyltransferase with HDIG domain